MGRIIPAFFQFFGDDAEPLANGWLQFLVSGTNNTAKNTYADSIFQIANANPLQLDAEGRCPDVFGRGDYRVISFVNDPEDEDSPGEMIQMFDPVTSQGDITGGGGEGSVFDAWDSLITYGIGSIVERDLGIYRSLIASNLGLDPLIETYAWEQIDFVRIYNATISYNLNDFVYYDSNLWLSLAGSNLNNTPDVSPAYWRQVASGYVSFTTVSTSRVIAVTERDIAFVLTSSATADSTFTLPTVSALYDRFRVAVYNASDYTLTVESSGTAGIWLSSGGSIDIEKGALVELIYSSYEDNWLVFGNSGPAMGGQDIGTTDNHVATVYADSIGIITDTVAEAYIDDLEVTDATITTLLATSVGTVGTPVTDIFATDATITTLLSTTVGSSGTPVTDIYTDDIYVNDYVYVGSSQELQITHDGVSAYFTNTVGSTYLEVQGALDSIIFRTLSTPRWQISNSGDLEPLDTGYDLGSTGYKVGEIYQATDSYHYLGDSLDMSLHHNGTVGVVQTYSGQLLIKTIDLESIGFYTQNDLKWTIHSTGRLYPTDTEDIGSISNPIGTLYYSALNLVSDLRKKADIEESFGLDFILELNPVSYRRLVADDGNRHHGMIAQDVNAVLTKSGHSTYDFGAVQRAYNGEWGLDYVEFIAPLINAVKELKEMVDGKADK